jgi:hypothetical protein
MKKRILMIGCPVLIFLFSQPAKVSAQLTVTGANCVMSSTIYDYIINDTSGDTAKINVCIIGGVFESNKNTCREIKPNTTIKVIWTDSLAGKLNVNSQSDNTKFDVNVTNTLSGGLIDSFSVTQILDEDSIPATLSCSKAKGGNCNPSYKYQWQESKDNIKYQDINGEVMENLRFSKTIKHSTYYRRKVTDIISNSTAYSSVAAVLTPLKSKKKK